MNKINLTKKILLLELLIHLFEITFLSVLIYIKHIILYNLFTHRDIIPTVFEEYNKKINSEVNLPL